MIYALFCEHTTKRAIYVIQTTDFHIQCSFSFFFNLELNTNFEIRLITENHKLFDIKNQMPFAC